MQRILYKSNRNKVPNKEKGKTTCIRLSAAYSFFFLNKWCQQCFCIHTNAGFEIVLFKGICADQSKWGPVGSVGCLPSHVGPIERLFGHACVHVAMVSGGRVHHVTVGWGLHWLLGIWLGAHHTHLHLHRVLGCLTHVAMVAVVTTVHHRLGHAVPIHGIQSIHVHVHRVDIVGRSWHQVYTHVHASLHR